MADVLCIKCGEPFDADEFHDWDGKTYDENRSAFFTQGCAGIGMTCNDVPNHGAAQVSSALYDLMGDDLDGILSGMEDAEMFGLL